MISQRVASKKELPEQLSNLYAEYYQYKVDIENQISSFISPLANETYFLIEYPYVDKVYRDSYYRYFSSKLAKYSRNCIRVSIFSEPLNADDFLNPSEHNSLYESYCGFFAVRPTLPNPIGRTIIDKKVLKNNDFLICETSFPVTSNGLKFHVKGFPYSSQDGETISCAETSLWGIMEYFGNRYAEYSPTLPSKIINTLKSISVERQLPSLGLQYSDLSYALKTFGFGTRIYAKSDFADDFENLMSCYVESGIPVIIATSNDNSIQHAFLLCGREKLDQGHFNQLKNKTGLIDFDSIKKEFVFVDDNHFPYQKALLEKPCSYYADPAWKESKIKYFIAPLYPKIYLEAYEAKQFCKQFIKQVGVKEAILRVLLTSSRSYKDELLKNAGLPNEYKKVVISTPMPKFIWVCELSNKKLIENAKCFGSLILDATEPNISQYKPLIYLHLHDIILKKEKGLLSSIKPIKLKSAVLEYSAYKNNLNGF